MSLENEFSLIEKYFNQQRKYNSCIIKGIGDDCAIVSPPSKQHLYLSTDTLISGVHFPIDTSPEDIAIKSLAVNLSDLAAMGVKPVWFTLVLALPENIDDSWLQRFSQQLSIESEHYQVDLIGGDMSRSDQLSITIQAHGFGSKQCLLRDQAKVNDLIVVTAPLGAAALGLQIIQNRDELKTVQFSKDEKIQAITALNRPVAKIEQGLMISRYADCGIDISDGLLADLGHIIKQSHCGARLKKPAIPVADCLNSYDKEGALLMALTGGDDYQLCFTISSDNWLKMNAEYSLSQDFYVIGEIIEQAIIIIEDNGKVVDNIAGVSLDKLQLGYNHFG